MSRKKTAHNTIASNRKARFDYHLEDSVEAGLVLEGWEVKSLRAGKAQITDSYVLFKDGEAWLLGALITPLPTVSTHRHVDPTRTRKLLMSRREIDRLAGATEQRGYTCVCTELYWKGHLVKARVSLAKGKQHHDKRATQKERDWDRERQRLMRHSQR